MRACGQSSSGFGEYCVELAEGGFQVFDLGFLLGDVL